jgi:hypothetical protein
MIHAAVETVLADTLEFSGGKGWIDMRFLVYVPKKNICANK